MRWIHKPKTLPRCPICNSKNTVGKVMTARDTGNVTTGFYCSYCLIEWRNEGLISKPLWA